MKRIILLSIALLIPFNLFSNSFTTSLSFSEKIYEGQVLSAEIGGEFILNENCSLSLDFSLGSYFANIKNPQMNNKRIEYISLFSSIALSPSFYFDSKNALYFPISLYLTLGGKYGIFTSGSTGFSLSVLYSYSFDNHFSLLLGPAFAYTFAGDYFGPDYGINLKIKWRT